MTRRILLANWLLLAMTSASSIFVSQAGGQTAASTLQPSPSAQSPATEPLIANRSGATKFVGTSTPYRLYPNRFSRRAELYYRLYWGVDSLRLKYAESGEIVRFSFRVVDANKAVPLNDKKLAPVLIDPGAGVKLVVPSLEKVGQLRQSGTPQTGKMYWMAFSNKGRLVRPGDHVNVVIGDFRANGLVVE